MARKLKWGVIGSCGIARRRTIPEGIVPSANGQLAAVYDIDRTGNEEAAREFSARAAGSLQELLDAVDAAYVATPAYVHCEQVLACAAAGKPVLCEKPLGMSPSETERMLAACEGAGVALGTAFMMRFVAQHREAARYIREGRLGKPAYCRAQLSCWYPPIEGAWRQVPHEGGGGALMDLGGHCIDLLEMFFGPVSRVSCFTGRTAHPYPVEDSAVAMLAFACGAIGTVDTFFCIPDASSKNVLELYGSRGAIVARGTIGQGEAGEMTAFLEEEAAGYDARQARAAGGGVPLNPPPVNPYRAEVEEFAQAVIEGRQPACGAEAGQRSQKVLAACYESAREGRAVDVDTAPPAD